MTKMKGKQLAMDGVLEDLDRYELEREKRKDGEQIRMEDL